ncbi:hypothetical protein NC653_022919 [Populus alba x Populus x berolinensis]|uniref:Uncharacterized protein n=1 Tax=Populus alba x Populus x berolinensis TaxID=444605 RepID=A0AAD6QA02_9ROSI|nr:hypothetical protein NC653_022919 [Populus alba x Populus x berolinensis]
MPTGKSTTRPGFEKPGGSSSNSHLEPVPISDTGVLPADFVLEDPDSHFIYVCKKMDETAEVSSLDEPAASTNHFKNPEFIVEEDRNKLLSSTRHQAFDVDTIVLLLGHL